MTNVSLQLGSKEDLVLTPKQRRARNSHNKVERKYRDRLNTQYVHLLAVLPISLQRGGGEGVTADTSKPSKKPGSGGNKGDRGICKGEILDMATSRIKALEQEAEFLQQERDSLLTSVDGLQAMVDIESMGCS